MQIYKISFFFVYLPRRFLWILFKGLRRFKGAVVNSMNRSPLFMMKDYSLIANSGIQLLTIPLEINLQDKFTMWFHEWPNETGEEYVLDLVYEFAGENNTTFYKKKDLYDKGFFAEGQNGFTENDLREKDIVPLRRDDTMLPGVAGEIYKINFSDTRNNTLAAFENVWLPLPYFHKRSEKRFNFGPLNWARFKMIPRASSEGRKLYDVLIAFDTRTGYETDGFNERPTFPDQFKREMSFMVCSDEYKTMDMCRPGEVYSYIDSYLFKLVHPNLQKPSQIKGVSKKLNYIASYVYLIEYIAEHHCFPKVILYKDKDVEFKKIDMVVDIGNSSTTALLVEDGCENFNQISKLQLLDLTTPLRENSAGKPELRTYNNSFDMRLVFRRASFGDFGAKNSRQFVYPSLVRLGLEANSLIHNSKQTDTIERISTYSSPKRYLWDGKPNREEWQFLTLESDGVSDHILNLNGITNQLKSNGELDLDGNGGKTYHYSRRSLMTFAFLEMLVQARMQINGYSYREDKGKKEMPRKLKRLIVTCPTAMSKLEREHLIQCARNAVIMMENFEYANPKENTHPGSSIEIVPAVQRKSAEQKWYFDEATCAQLVYMFGEVGHKYKGSCDEFFNMYGKKTGNNTQNVLTVASLDIGAGTSDLMISQYSYQKGTVTTITPEPLFYDSYYFAGDDMLKGLINDLMMLDDDSAFYKKMKPMPYRECRQKLRDMFGPDYNGQSEKERVFRSDFNMQYSLPLMYYFLELVKRGSGNKTVRFHDVFEKLPPNEGLMKQFEEFFGFGMDTLEWDFDYEKVSKKISDKFEPYLKKIATIMFANACDIVILSGRPASLPPIRNIFLKYYPVSPDRLILLNNYYVGRWFPFGNNTGYITDPKTIVTMGAVIGHYSSKLASLNNFVIDTSKLDGKLKSTINFIEKLPHNPQNPYCITPHKLSGDISVSKLPAYLNVKQLGAEIYPYRSLYTIDFNRQKIANRIQQNLIVKGDGPVSDTRLQQLVNDELDQLRRRAPFKITLSKDVEDNETLSIEGITDREDNDLSGSNIEVHIQTLGAEDKYWLDDGAFEF